MGTRNSRSRPFGGGVGAAFGAASGLLFALLLGFDEPIALIAGVALGLVLGALFELATSRTRPPDSLV
jgi:hypothetical protein